MAQTDFKVGTPKVISKTDALKNAQSKDARSLNFHIPADKDEILTLTGEYVEIPWTRTEGKTKSEGTMLAVAAKRASGDSVNIPFGFFRTKRLLQEDGFKTFEACFPKDASFEQIVNSVEADKKVKVCRDGFLYPGRSSERDVDTVVWAK